MTPSRLLRTVPRITTLLLLASCDGKPPVVEAAQVIVVPAPQASEGPSSSATASAASATAPPVVVSPAMCTAAVDASPLVVPSTCFIDDKMGAKSGTLQYPCDGDGEAKLVLGDRSIAGVVRGGDLFAVIATDFDWQDGCHWRTVQTARGSIAGKVLVVEYKEAPDPSPEACSSPCEGHGEMRIR